jgi:hypothetical protein
MPMKNPNLEILEQIDSGLYGRVFRARQIDLDRLVAVKVIKQEFAQHADAIEHARALARVGIHPNIVTVYAVDDVELDGVKVPSMIMEWLEGEKFGVRLAGPRFSEQELRRICAGLFDGIERMHTSGMSHGDLHFGNVILTADCNPKIIDIDATRNRSLGRLSTISREGAIAADVDYCRQFVARAFGHSVLSPSLVNQLDDLLGCATSLADLRSVVERTLSRPRQSSFSVVNTRPAYRETAADVMEKVQEFIESSRPVSLHGLIMEQTRLMRDDLLSDRFPAAIPNYSTALVKVRISQYEECVGTILPALATGCFWGDESQWILWKQCIETAANCYEDVGFETRSGNSTLLDLRLYPPLLLWYACCLGAFLNGRFSTLQFLLQNLEYVYARERRDLVAELFYWIVAQVSLWNDGVSGGARSLTPINDHLCEVFSQALSQLTPLRSAFEVQFDRFEYFVGLMHCAKRLIAGSKSGDAPTGSFLWRQARTPDFGQYFIKEAHEHGDTWSPFKAGLFDRNEATVVQAVSLFEAYVNGERARRHVRMPRA